MRTSSAKGFTLIELMVVVAIIAILAVLAIPNFIDWLQNSKTRTLAGSVQDGLRFAQEEAIRLNRQTTFIPTANGWTVDYIANAAAAAEDTQPHPLQTFASPNGDTSTTITLAGTTPAVLEFSSLGRVYGGAAAAGPFSVLPGDATYQVRNPKGSRKLNIVVSQAGGGKVRMCDPDKPTFDPATSPDGCP